MSAPAGYYNLYKRHPTKGGGMRGGQPRSFSLLATFYPRARTRASFITYRVVRYYALPHNYKEAIA